MYPFKRAIFRLLLAAMHFNENFGRSKAVTKLGKERMKIVFPSPKIVPEAKHIVSSKLIGSFIIADIFTEYVNTLLLRIVELCTHKDNRPSLLTAPSLLASQHEHPNKDTIPLFSRIKFVFVYCCS